MNLEMIEALTSASPAVIMVATALATWKASQHMAQKRIDALEARIEALESREAELMAALLKKAGLS